MAYHIVKHLNEAVDQDATGAQLVRRGSKGNCPTQRFKNTKFQTLLKAKHNRSAKDKRVLREQVRANRRLYRAMLLRDDFMDLYTYKTETWAKKFLRGWLRRAMSSRIEPVKRAAKMIPKRLSPPEFPAFSTIAAASIGHALQHKSDRPKRQENQ